MHLFSLDIWRITPKWKTDKTYNNNVNNEFKEAMNNTTKLKKTKSKLSTLCQHASWHLKSPHNIVGTSWKSLSTLYNLLYKYRSNKYMAKQVTFLMAVLNYENTKNILVGIDLRLRLASCAHIWHKVPTVNINIMATVQQIMWDMYSTKVLFRIWELYTLPFCASHPVLQPAKCWPILVNKINIRPHLKNGDRLFLEEKVGRAGENS